MISQVVASEQERAQTVPACRHGVVGLHLERIIKQNSLESLTIVCESHVSRN